MSDEKRRQKEYEKVFWPWLSELLGREWKGGRMAADPNGCGRYFILDYACIQEADKARHSFYVLLKFPRQPCEIASAFPVLMVDQITGLDDEPDYHLLLSRLRKPLLHMMVEYQSPLERVFQDDDGSGIKRLIERWNKPLENIPGLD